MLYFIVNALSGKGKGGETAKKIEAILSAKKVEFKMFYTKAKYHAIELARNLSQKDDCTGIVAVGGDGTFSEVLNGLDLRVPLGVVSSGTGNDFMRTYAPGKTLEEQLEPIIAGTKKHIDFLHVNDMRSLNVTGTGFDVDILLRERKLRKYLSGSLSYYSSLLLTLFTMKFRNFSLKIDNEKSVNASCLILSMANGRYFGGGMPVSLESDIADGVMELLLVKKLPFYRVPDVLARFLAGKIKNVKKYVEIYHCTCVEGAVTPAVMFNIDGELYDMPEFKVTLKKGALTIFA